MSTFRCDNLIPDALVAQVVAGQTYTSRGVPLSGVAGISVQAMLAGGAAGTIFIDGCNQPIPSQANQLPANSPVNWLNVSSQALSANQQVVLSYSLVDQITSMHNIRIRFVPTSSGSINVSLNCRRMTD